jgi:hypothetical protein
VITPHRAAASGWTRAPALLALIIVVLAVLPLAVFATDLPNSRALRAAREQVAERSGRHFVDEDPDVRRRRLMLRRETLGTTWPRIVESMVVQFAFVAAAGIVGRRVFGLRL